MTVVPNCFVIYDSASLVSWVGGICIFALTFGCGCLFEYGVYTMERTSGEKMGLVIMALPTRIGPKCLDCTLIDKQ
jgi:hypothetical protein